MGKNKGNKGSGQKGKKEKAFVVNTIKKSKTKIVSSNLKKLNLQTKAKTEMANESFKAVQDVIMEAAKSSTEKPKPSNKPVKKKQPTSSDTASAMETALEDFSKL